MHTTQQLVERIQMEDRRPILLLGYQTFTAQVVRTGTTQNKCNTSRRNVLSLRVVNCVTILCESSTQSLHYNRRTVNENCSCDFCFPLL